MERVCNTQEQEILRIALRYAILRTTSNQAKRQELDLLFAQAVTAMSKEIDDEGDKWLNRYRLE